MLSCNKLKRDMAARKAGRGRVNQAAGMALDDDQVDSVAAPGQEYPVEQ